MASRFPSFLLFLILFEVAISFFSSMPFYTVSGQTVTFGQVGTIALKPNTQLNNANGLLKTVGCGTNTNGSTNCTAPAALSTPSILSVAGVFGWFVGVLISFYYVAIAPMVTLNILLQVGVWAPFAGMISTGVGVIYYYFLALLISGRYFE